MKDLSFSPVIFIGQSPVIACWCFHLVCRRNSCNVGFSSTRKIADNCLFCSFFHLSKRSEIEKSVFFLCDSITQQHRLNFLLKVCLLSRNSWQAKPMKNNLFTLSIPFIFSHSINRWIFILLLCTHQ